MTVFVQPRSPDTHRAADRLLQQRKVTNYNTIVNVVIRVHHKGLLRAQLIGK